MHQGKNREKAFRLRMERKTLTEVSKETGVSTKTLSRWERGWVDARGRKHPGWKAELDKAWTDLAHKELGYGLLLKEERLKAYEELASLAVNRVKEMFPSLRAKTAADAKALLSEIRELCKLIAEEKGEFRPGPRTLIAVKTDINLNELRERYRSTHADPEQDDAKPGDAGEAAGDNGEATPGA
jgi:hypothetical protein